MFNFFYALLMIFYSLFSFGEESRPQENMPKNSSLILKEGTDLYSLGPSLYLFEDRTGKLSFNDIQNPKFAKKFKQNLKAIPNFGFTKSIIWAKVSVDFSKYKKKKKWLFSYNYIQQDKITLFEKIKGQWLSISRGDTFKKSKEKYGLRSFILETKNEYQGIAQFIFRIEGSPIRIDLTLGTKEFLLKKEYEDTRFYFLFFGLAIGVLFYNFFIFLSTKSLSNLFYVIYICSMLLFYGGLKGFTQLYLFSNSPWFSNNGFALTVSLSLSFLLLFSKSYLNLKKNDLMAQKLTNGLLILNFLLALSSFILPYSFNARFLTINSFITLMLVFIISLRQIKTYRPAKYYFLAFFSFLTGTILYTLMTFDLLPHNFFTANATTFGNALELILLSIGLADRFNFIQERALIVEEKAHNILKVSLEKEKESSYNLKLSTLQREEDHKQLTSMYKQLEETNELLEEKVEERTKELNSSLKKLKKSAEEKSTFYAKISHELRTPLNAILGFSQILLEQVNKDINIPQKREYIQCILSSGQSLLGLINEVHDFSKLNLNQLIIKNKPFSIQNMVNNISTFFVNESEKKGLDFFFHFDETIPTSLIGDELRLKQILYNLLGNSIKFTDRGFLKLSIENRQQKENRIDLLIKVEDSGIGIKEENLEKIFDTFGQIDDIIPKEGGSGLGLYITKMIIEKMGGKISVNSEYNKGTIFTVELFSLSIGLDSMESIKGISLLNYKFFGDTILIADDLENNLALIEAFLEPLNLKLEKVKNGIDLIRKAVDLTPALIITDIKMPSLDGHKAAKKLGQIMGEKKIPIIGVSAIQENKSISSDFDSFLEKPLDRSLLILEISKFLKHEKGEVKKDDFIQNIKSLFYITENLGDLEKDLLLKMKTIFEETMELQNITELENHCHKLLQELDNSDLNYLKSWFEKILFEISTFQIDLLNDHLKDALSKIEKASIFHKI